MFLCVLLFVFCSTRNPNLLVVNTLYLFNIGSIARQR